MVILLLINEKLIGNFMLSQILKIDNKNALENVKFNNAFNFNKYTINKIMKNILTI